MNRTQTTLVRALAIGGLAMLGGGVACSDEPTTEESRLSAAEYDDVATTMGALVADDRRGQPNAFGGAVALARGVVPTNFQISGGIAIGELLGFDYNFSVACTDDAGATVACGDDAHAADVEVSWSGEWNGDNSQATNDFDGEWSLVGLDEDLVLLDGSADALATIDWEVDGEERTFSIEYTAVYMDVGLDTETGRAVSGSVSYDLTIERGYPARDGTAVKTSSVDADATFQADGTVTLVLDTDQVYRMRRDGTVELVARGTLE